MNDKHAMARPESICFDNDDDSKDPNDFKDVMQPSLKPFSLANPNYLLGISKSHSILHSDGNDIVRHGT
jgi:hypothetical protein